MATKTMTSVEKPVRGSYKQQLAKIAAEDDTLDASKLLDKEKRINEISQWFERSEEKLVDIQLEKRRQDIKKELKLAEMAFSKVRKEAMKRLYEKETEMYNVELQSEDKTFQLDRM